MKSLTGAASAKAQTGVTLNTQVLDFNLNTATDGADSSLIFSTDLVANALTAVSEAITSTDADGNTTTTTSRVETVKWTYSSVWVDAAGETQTSDLSFDASEGYGARFYDLTGSDGIADNVVLTLVDGGYGDKDLSLIHI